MHPYFEMLSPAELSKTTIYTGSIGPAFHDFRYRLKPDAKESKIYAATYSVYCYDKAKDVEETEFPYDDNGVEQLKVWLQGEYENYQLNAKAAS